MRLWHGHQRLQLQLVQLLVFTAQVVGVAPQQAGSGARELALCLSFELRGICAPEDFQSLFRVILAHFASVDVFLALPAETCEHDVGMFTEAARRHHGDIRLFPLCQSNTLTEEEELVQDWQMGTEEGRELGFHHPDRFVNLLRMWRHVGACAPEIEARMSDAEYRFVARARPDQEWHSFIDRDELEAMVPPLILTNFVGMPIHGVVEDTFAIGTWAEMKPYLEFHRRYLMDVAVMSKTTMRPGCIVHATLRSSVFCDWIAGEFILEAYMLRHERLQMQKRRSICADKVLPCMQRRTHYCTRIDRHPHGFVDTDSAIFDRNNRDFFLTAGVESADYDSVLTARVAHFLHAEAIRLGHPPRVLDLGCGRGSMVEALNSWFIPAIGVDGDSVIDRSLPKHTIRWDLTEPLDIESLYQPAQPGWCRFVSARIATANLLAARVAARIGESKAVVIAPLLPMSFVPLDVVKLLCCKDIRCAGYALADDMSLLLKFVLKSSGEGDGMDVERPIELRDSMEYWVDGASPVGAVGAFSRNELMARHGRSVVKFSTVDWAISFGLGSDAPAWARSAILSNIARHSAEGAIIGWRWPARTKSDSAMSAERLELMRALRKHGLEIDLASTKDLQLFAGLAHSGPARADILVLRRSGWLRSLRKESARVELVEELTVGSSCRPSGTSSSHKFPTFGPLGPGSIWARYPCQGSFRVPGSAETMVCVGMVSGSFTECALPANAAEVGPSTPQEHLEEGGPPAARIDAFDASLLYDTSDHLVPAAGVWRGDARLNLVFFKTIRALVAPARTPFLQEEWAWFWTTSWRQLVEAPPKPSPTLLFLSTADREMDGWFVAWQVGRVLEAVRRLACRLMYAADGSGAEQPRAAAAVPSRWSYAVAGAKALRAACLRCAAPEAESCMPKSELFRQLDAVQQEVTAKTGSMPVAQALTSEPTLIFTLLPLLRDILLSYAVSGKVQPEPSFLEFSGLSEIKEGCGRREDYQQPADFWAGTTRMGWYLYRLAAVDPWM